MSPEYETDRYVGMMVGIVMVVIGFGGIFTLGVMASGTPLTIIMVHLEIFTTCCALIVIGAWLFVDSKSG